MQPRRYMLRYALMLRNADRRIPELVAYCRRCAIDSVMIITESHSMHLRHRTIEEAGLYGRMLCRCGDALREAGIEFGLNVWQILGHHDAGFSSITHFGWRPMVGHDGTLSERSPCPLDPRFHAHMTGVLQAYARCQPDYLYLDDDFRWHNHVPVEWGCYCPQHLEAFGQKIGRPVTRDELLQLVYGPKYPAPQARILWHETLREGLEQLAGTVEQAVHSVSPDTVIGLMSSAPQVHSAEGRRWRALLAKLSRDVGRPLNRPGMTCYREFNAREALEGINLARMTAALVAPDTRITPELESSPFTRFNKSTAHARLQMALSYFCVSPELTLDLHSFISPDLDEEPAMGDMLRHARPYFDHLAEAGLHAGWRGLNAVLLECAADHARSRQPTPEGCVLHRPWEVCLPLLGIPVWHSEVWLSEGTPARCDNPLPRVISGDLPLAASDETLRDWLQGPLLLDATAAECFGLRGLAGFVGVDVGEGVGHRHVGGEEILEAGFGGERGTWMALRHMNGNVHRLSPHPGATVVSRLLWGDEIGAPAQFGPGVVLFHNSLGGRVAVLPFDGQTDTVEAVQFRNHHRQRQLHAIVGWLAPEAPFVGLSGAANLAPFWKQSRTEIILGLANLSLDPMPATVLWRNLPRPLAATLATYDTARGLRIEQLDFEFVDDQLRFRQPVPPWQLSLLRIGMATA